MTTKIARETGENTKLYTKIMSADTRHSNKQNDFTECKL